MLNTSIILSFPHNSKILLIAITGLDDLHQFSDKILRQEAAVQEADVDINPLMHERYIPVENVVRKGEIACIKQFLLFLQCFLPYMALFFLISNALLNVVSVVSVSDS